MGKSHQKEKSDGFYNEKNKERRKIEWIRKHTHL